MAARLSWLPKRPLKRAAAPARQLRVSLCVAPTGPMQLGCHMHARHECTPCQAMCLTCGRASCRLRVYHAVACGRALADAHAHACTWWLIFLECLSFTPSRPPVPAAGSVTRWCDRRAAATYVWICTYNMYECYMHRRFADARDGTAHDSTSTNAALWRGQGSCVRAVPLDRHAL